MKSISRFGSSGGCWCQDLVTDPQFPVFKYINWFARSIFWKTRTQTDWHRLELRQDCSGRLPCWERASERESERESRGKKKRQDLARLSQISFFCLLSRLELRERKPSWGTEKLRTFWFSNLDSFLSLLGCLKVVVH